MVFINSGLGRLPYLRVQVPATEEFIYEFLIETWYSYKKMGYLK